MKKTLIAVSLFLSVFPSMIFGACTGRSIVDDQNGSNCTGSGGAWNYSSCTCSCPTGYYVQGGSGGSCISESYQGSSSQSETFGGGSTSGGSSSGGSTSGGSSASVTLPSGSSTGTIGNPISSNTFADLIMMIVKWIKNIALALAPLVVVWGGVLCITSSGDAKKFQTGKDMILYAAIGLLVVLLAEGLVGILKDLVVK